MPARSGDMISIESTVAKGVLQEPRAVQWPAVSSSSNGSVECLMFTLPFIRELSASRRVLLAGAGGGFDIFCGLPLYFALREQGKEVYLANLSFTRLEDCTGTRLTPALL